MTDPIPSPDQRRREIVDAAFQFVTTHWPPRQRNSFYNLAYVGLQSIVHLDTYHPNLTKQLPDFPEDQG